MEIIIYGLIFIIGTLFGSFFTLAVYRIPLGEDILYKHSFCPNCMTKLRFQDLIPVISYIKLGGKCASCGQKIRIRYLCLEVLSGLVFLLFALSLKMNFLDLDANMIVYFLLYILYIATLFIIAGIDKENIQIQKSVFLFGIILSFCYMTYVCIQNITAVYTYIIYLTLIILILILDIIFLRKKLYSNYTLQVLMLFVYMMIFSGSTISYMTIIFALVWIAVETLLVKIKERKKNRAITKTEEEIKLPMGYYLCVSNILLIIVFNFLNNWVI